MMFPRSDARPIIVAVLLFLIEHRPSDLSIFFGLYTHCIETMHCNIHEVSIFIVFEGKIKIMAKVNAKHHFVVKASKDLFKTIYRIIL